MPPGCLHDESPITQGLFVVCWKETAGFTSTVMTANAGIATSTGIVRVSKRAAERFFTFSTSLLKRLLQLSAQGSAQFPQCLTGVAQPSFGTNSHRNASDST